MQPQFLIGWRASLSALVLSSCVAVAPGAAPAGEDEPIEPTWLNVCVPVTTPITDILIENLRIPTSQSTLNVHKVTTLRASTPRQPLAIYRTLCSRRTYSPFPL